MKPSNAFLQQVIALVPVLRAFGRSLCADANLAEDLVQDTILKAWDNRARFQWGSNMKAWLLTILRNRYYSELRHRRFEVEDPDGKHAAGLTVQPDHEVASEVDALSRALDELRDEQRQALLLVFAGGLSYTQAASVCNCAVGTIKSRIARGRDHLSELLGPIDSPRMLARKTAVKTIEDSDDNGAEMELDEELEMPHAVASRSYATDNNALTYANA